MDIRKEIARASMNPAITSPRGAAVRDFALLIDEPNKAIILTTGENILFGPWTIKITGTNFRALSVASTLQANVGDEWTVQLNMKLR